MQASQKRAKAQQPGIETLSAEKLTELGTVAKLSEQPGWTREEYVSNQTLLS